MVLLNCGANSYVPELAPPSANNVRYVIIDSHRPVDVRYNNPDDLDAVMVLAGDDPLPHDVIPPCSDLDNLTEDGALLLGRRCGRQGESGSQGCCTLMSTFGWVQGSAWQRCCW